MNTSVHPWRRPLAGLLILPLIGACSPTYLFHVGVGHARIMMARRPYADVLKDPAATSQDKSLLLEVQQVKRFGEERLGLADTDNFDSFVRLDRPAVSWIVVGAEKTRLSAHEWWFPFVGRVPYKGYYNPDQARREAAALERRGLDVDVRPVAAYSTLGYFADPVFSTFLRFPEAAIPELILHELTHATLFARGQVDFNEGFATFVGQKGGLAFLEERYGADSPLVAESLARSRDELAFGRFVGEVSERLEALYESPLSDEEKIARREKVFRESKLSFAKLRERFSSNSYDDFAEAEWNNAVILANRRYYGDLPRFETLYAALGGDLEKFVAYFVDAKERGEDLTDALERGGNPPGGAKTGKERS
ncbi:MAG: aminopeptidase [Deltaproteobacteria bacterium]|nr:aminopeptidase [Deltaproteobacteria bacterium]